MAEEEISLTEEEKRIGSVAAYEIHKQRQINEDRVLAERTSMFLLATTFLFLAFVVLLDPEWDRWIHTVLRIALPLVGIFLTLLLLRFNVSAVKALGRWHDAQCQIEKALEAEVFRYMKANGILPHGRKSHWFTSTRTIYRCYLPIVFLALWVTSLVFVIICYF